jgi:hypothetical protein
MQVLRALYAICNYVWYKVARQLAENRGLSSIRSDQISVEAAPDEVAAPR